MLLLLFRLSITGRKNVPKKGTFILASNHVSYLDPGIVAAVSSRRVYFIAGDHLYEKWLSARWFEGVGCIRIRRNEADHRAIRKVLDTLKAGKPLAMFPEGTRSPDGRMQEASNGIGFIALKSGVPVVPCFVSGSEKAFPRGARFFKFQKVRVYVGKPIYPNDFRFEGSRKDSYKAFSKSVMEAIAGLGRQHENKSV